MTASMPLVMLVFLSATNWVVIVAILSHVSSACKYVQTLARLTEAESQHRSGVSSFRPCLAVPVWLQG